MGMGQIVDYSQFILQIEKAIANGVASLDSNAKVPKNQISLNASDVGAIATGGTAGTANKFGGGGVPLQGFLELGHIDYITNCLF